MKHTYIIAGLLSLIIVMTAAGGVLAGGSAKAKIGYVVLDETGNLGVNSETYNLYEGGAFSLEDFRYLTKSGVNLTADLKNITLNNRNLSAAIYKPGLFSLSAYNNQYRRTYDYDGRYFTRRRSTGATASISPTQHFRLFGDFSQTDRYGDTYSIISPTSDTVISANDYSQTEFSVGAEGYFTQGSGRIEYRHYSFTDNSQFLSRNADLFSASVSAPMPRHDWINLAGGYNYRQDKLDTPAIDLTTHQGWGATKMYLPYRLIFDYRILFARTKQGSDGVETDNAVNTVTISHNWPAYGGLRVGYENRISDDLTNRTVSDGFLASGWFRYRTHFSATARMSTRSRNVKTGVTLLGDEDYTRYQISGTYRQDKWGDLTLGYQGRQRTNDNIGTRVDYRAATAALNLKREEYGTLSVTYSYYLGKFDNRSLNTADRFEFSDHVVTGLLIPREYKKTQVELGGTYYRSRRRVDIEKFGVTVAAAYHFPMASTLEVRYQAVNYDDFLVSNQYYTGNIVTINMIKGFAF